MSPRCCNKQPATVQQKAPENPHQSLRCSATQRLQQPTTVVPLRCTHPLKGVQRATVGAMTKPNSLSELAMEKRRLAHEEGLFVGMSSGAALVAALEVARGMPSGTVVVLFPDRGDRYLSTNLFTSICAACPP